MNGFSEGAKPRSRIECDLPRFHRRPAHSQTARGQRRNQAERPVVTHGSRSERDSESGPSERRTLRRVNPRSGASGDEPDAGLNGMPSRASNVADGVALAGRPEIWTARPKTLQGTKPHESRGGSQGAPQSFGSHSEGEPKPTRDDKRGNPRITADTENPKAEGCDSQPNRTGGSLKP